MRENPCRSIRTSIIKGAYIYSPKSKLQISGSGALTKFTDFHIPPWKVTHFDRDPPRNTLYDLLRGAPIKTLVDLLAETQPHI